MDNGVLSALDSCLRLSRRLERKLQQDSNEMDECTRGAVLEEYREMIEQAINQTHRIDRRLQALYDEQKMQMQ